MSAKTLKHIIAIESDGTERKFASMNQASKHYNVNVHDIFLCVNNLKQQSKKAGNVVFKVDLETQYPETKMSKKEQDTKRKLYQLARYYAKLYSISENKESFIKEHKNLKDDVLLSFKRMIEENSE